jgi:hypothetical protein
MQTLTFVVVLALVGVQATGADYSGTWIATRGDTTYVQLELSADNGTLRGRLGLGDVQVDASGDVAGAQPIRNLTPLAELDLRDGRLLLARPDGDDTDHFEMRLLGNDAAELLFKPTAADLRDLGDNHVPLPKPFRLKKVVR